MIHSRDPAGSGTPSSSVSVVTVRNSPWLGDDMRSPSSTTGVTTSGSSFNALEPLGVLDEELGRLGEQLGGGLVAGHHELLHDREDLGELEGPLAPLGVLEAGLGEVGEDVVLGVRPPILDEVVPELLALDDAPGRLAAGLGGEVGAEGGHGGCRTSA